MIEKLLITLQEIVSHQEEEIARLSAELYAQQRDVKLLKAEMAALQAMIKTGMLQDSPMRSPEQETPPPHY